MSRATILTIGLLFSAAPASAGSITVAVAGTSNIWLAGAVPGTTALFSDTAPAQSPVQVTGLDFGASSFTFSATGTVSNGICCPLVGPDGNTASYTSHLGGAQNGISDITTPINSLIGVFLDDSVPGGTAPAALNFASLGLSFTSLTPSLRQVFFIGNGLAGATQQTFFVPTGATRLFLGTMDAFDNNNNLGSFSVTVSDGALAPIPEPATVSLLAAGLAAVILRRRLARSGVANCSTRASVDRT